MSGQSHQSMLTWKDLFLEEQQLPAEVKDKTYQEGVLHTYTVGSQA